MTAQSTGTASWLDRLRPERQTLLWGALLVNLELLALAAYALRPDVQLLDPLSVRYWLYPFVWINVGIWAIVRTSPSPSTVRDRRIAIGIAVAYFALLAYAGGLLTPGMPSMATGLEVSLYTLPPGFSPAVSYLGPVLSVSLLPYKVVGYLALSYLVYATVVDAAGSAVSGLLGLLSCVSCTWPVLASLASGLIGGAVAGTVYSLSYDLSTVVFVLTVGLLYWRPFGR
jgi:hypothetical protein